MDDHNPIDDFGTPIYSEVADSYPPPLAGDPGFFPEDGPTNREEVSAASYETSSYGSGPAVEVVEEASWGGGPETIVVRELPFETYDATFNTSPSSANGLPSGASYAWVGVMEVYVYAPAEQLSYPDGDGAHAVVTISDADGDIVSQFPLPEYTNLKGASVARINLFIQKEGLAEYYFYQILPDTRLYTDDDQFGNVVGDGAPVGVVNVRGSQRN